MALFNFFKKNNADKKEVTQKPEANEIPVDKELLSQIANKTYPGLGIYVRDINLPKSIADKYTPGLIIRERAFVDVSNRVMGMITTHRYLILSNHVANLSAFEHGTNWGLHVANKDSRFKVLGTHVYETHDGEEKTAIVLLHLPEDESWKVYKNCAFSMDETVYKMAVERFEKKCEMPPVPELTTQKWLARCAFPIGMSDDGTLWELE